ncbi:methyltransferase-like protein 24 [Elysia marginata]|uniref:Methyltransferase-like protein 24 n=1 Tax=Elysia marginata TaxID=1093978 RepID=A0AAV4HNA9_9GAST|nr:methyltransferase-like protein 24 [Elysia marginata]
MPRLHLKKVVALTLCLGSLCILLIFLRGHGKALHQGQMVDDRELWALLEPVKSTRAVPQTPAPRPQIHVKKLPGLSINPNWTAKQMEHTFFKYLENKDIRCENDMRIGNWNDGGWNVCLSPPFKVAEPCVVFSFGIGNDWQFDDSISTMYGCRVLAFDPRWSSDRIALAASLLISAIKVLFQIFNPFPITPHPFDAAPVYSARTHRISLMIDLDLPLEPSRIGPMIP